MSALEKITVLASIGALFSVLIPEVAHAQSLEHFLESKTGIQFGAGDGNSLVARIGSCTAVVQDQHNSGIKIFTFDGSDSLAGSTGLSTHDIAALKVEFGNPGMTTDELTVKLEGTNKEVVLKVLESLKSNCATTS